MIGCILCCGGHAFSQTPSWLWLQGTGTSGYQNGVGISASPAGDIYIGGRLTGGTSNFMGLSVTSPSTAAFHGRFQPSGNFVWANVHPYGSFDYMFAFCRDASDNTYATGCINSSASGIYVQRYNSAGTQTLSVTVPASNVTGTAIAADDAGNIYVGGDFANTVTFGSTTLTPAGGADIFLVKYNSAGVVQWARRIGSAGADKIKGMTVDKAGNVYFTGGYNTGTSTFGSITAPAATGYGNYFIACYDPSGNAVWVQTVGNAGPVTSPDNAADITIDTCGNLYVTGTFKGPARFGAFNLAGFGGFDMFVGKLSAGGTWEWVQSGGGASDRDEGLCIALDRDNDVYVGGIYQNTISIAGTTLTNASSATDVFVAKFANSTGDVLWAQRAGGTDYENCGGITVDRQKFVYLTGTLSGTTIFGSLSLSSGSPGDMFIAKLDTVPERRISVVLNSPYCTGSVLSQPFTVTGSFTAGNVFTAQLSDANGSFVTPVNIGTLTGTGSGTINITIPAGTPPGNNYRIRIISSAPAWSSYDYCRYISIIGPCKPVILNGDSTALDTVHCYADVNKAIRGIPGGGTFTGCGIVSIGGNWYFNPAQAAAGAASWPHQCRIIYRLPGGDSVSRMMTVQQPVVVDLGRDTSGCAGDTITLQSRVSYPGATSQWSTGAATPSLRVGTSGSYWLEITNNGCTGRDTADVTIAPRPAVNLGSDTSLCDRDIPLTLSSPQPAGTQYLWSTGLSTSSIEVTRTDIYWLEATLGDCKGSDTIVVNVIPTPSIHIGNDSFICEGQPVNIGDVIPGATYLWSTGSTASSIAVSESGSYWLTADLEGCKVSDTVLITVTPLPAPDLGPDGDICPEQVIVLDAGDAHYPVSSYRWNTGDTTSALSVSNAGTYWVEVTSPYSCKGYDTVTFTYHPLPTVLLGDDTTVCEETPLVLHAFSVNSDSLRWSDGSTGASLTITEGGVYMLSGINKCGETRDTVSIKQIFCDIWVPNAFTPNGDGVNDVFRVLGNVGRLESFRLRVFNRWGQLLFETSDKRKGWDGRQQDGEVPLGVYVYMLEYSLNDQPVLQKGNFTLLR